MSPARFRTLFAAACAVILVSVAALLPAAASASQIGAQRAPAQQGDPCNPAGGIFANPIVEENCKTGNPAGEWDVTGAGDLSIQGYATDISVAPGATVNFKIDTPSNNYKLDIYRMGYYAGAGARYITTVQPSATLPQTQPACTLASDNTQLVDCGNWDLSASWPVPTDAVSGIYFAKLTREDVTPAGGSHIVFIVRDDTRGSAILFQTSDTTWQAYNNYGGHSLYYPSQGERAYKVSYNRPFVTRSVDNGQDWVFHAEYPMVRWLEANGYDVSYFTGVDADRLGAELLEHKSYLSVGHDEYWSQAQRTHVTAARDEGVDLAFFSGNEIFWKTRWEDSAYGGSGNQRTLVSYKETHSGAKIDPLPVWTGTWRDVRPINPQGSQPENALSGQIFMVDAGSTTLRVPYEEGKLRLWRNSAAAALAQGGAIESTANTVGYEWDESLDNGAAPAGLIHLSSHTTQVPEYLQDNGSSYAPGTATHRISLYRHGSGATSALVFGAGTIQWSWGLDSNHDNGSAAANLFMQQATVNLFADMGVQPATLQAGLAAATASTDVTPPTSQILAPANGGAVEAGLVTVGGTATDAGGGRVGAVEVSVDGGTTWHEATGRAVWSYTFTPRALGNVTIISRAVDDSGWIETPGSGITVNVEPRTCPCSIWEGTGAPADLSDTDGVPIEVGVKFQTDSAGYITALRYYKSPLNNTGTNVGHLWTSTGSLLATATFVSESASGWQEVTLGAPVAVTPNTTYVASYHTTNGHYASTEGGLTAGVFNLPVRALASGVDGDNGVFIDGASTFPNQSFNATNYWVDVVFNTAVGPDTTPPVVEAVTPGSGVQGVSTAVTLHAVFNELLAVNSLAGNFELRDASNTLVNAAITYESAAHRLVLDPAAALANSTLYTAKLKGGTTGIKDAAGNALAADYTWSFTTAAPSGPPPDQGPGGPILVIANAANPFTRYYAEILRAEGLNAFAVSDIGAVNATLLANYQVAILGEMTLTAAQVNDLTAWVQGGGNLIAMRPDPQLYALLGLNAAAGALAEGYFGVNTATGPGVGIEAQTMQFHGTADRFTLNGATAVATLYNDATSAAPNPAVTLHSAGSGQAAAFAFDLARSVVYTRQGNPAWAGQKRDGEGGPIRPDDLFFGAKVDDVKPDWVDHSKIAIPQADEAQRLLANLITSMNSARMPLPRFWYFPRGEKAVVVMTQDNHGEGDIATRLNGYNAASPTGCSVNDWECVRSTTYLYVSALADDAQLAAFQGQGHEFVAHVDTGCANFTTASLEQNYADDLAAFAQAFPSANAPKTQRTHCIAFSDWASQPTVELENGIRLDTNYYYWPATWVNNTPGLFTGTGMPMRFADVDGTLIDVYQATTQMTDESAQSYPATINTLLDNALGSLGYYGAFVSNQHADGSSLSAQNAAAIVASAQARDVPVVSAVQLLTWLDGRNASSFANMQFAADTLSFDISVGAGANGLVALAPVRHGAQQLSALKRGGVAVSYTVSTIKGVAYAQFSALAGSYTVEYANDETVPTISSVSPADGATGVALNTTISAVFSEAMDAATLTATSFELRDAANAVVAATLSYAAGTNTATLTPSAPLAYGTQYTARVTTAVQDAAGNALAQDQVWIFTTLTAPYTCPCSIWTPGTVPVVATSGDNSAYDLGVRFRSSIAGYVKGVRFYRGATGDQTFTAKLWDSTGHLLASAPLVGVATVGWQEVLFATPVAIAANTTYVASYFVPASAQYPFTANYFTSSGVDAPPLRALRSGEDGPNGVFAVGGGFPTSSFNDTNYFVDVVFDLTPTSVDSTPPTLIQRTPAAAATNVAVGTPVTARFSEPIKPATLTTASFTLRDASNNLVSATVSYAAGTSTATLTPSAPLAYGTQYTARVTTAVQDVAGNALATEQTWSFTTATGTPVCPCSIWDSAAGPTGGAVTNVQPIEVGTKFRSSMAGQVTALRFYKGAGDTDTHVGHLWAADGAQLAEIAFTGETASGWQQMALPSPVTIQPNTTYIVSVYSSPTGKFVLTQGYFDNAHDNPPLRALASSEDGGNGMFKEGAGGGFPTTPSGQNSSYWVDVVFDTTIVADTTPPTISARTPAAAAVDVAIGDNVTVQFSEAMNAATLSESTITLRAEGAASDVTAAVAYNAVTHLATLNPDTDLAYATLYHVTVAGSVADTSDNHLGGDVTWSFTTAAPPPLGDDTLAEFSAGASASCYLASADNGEVILAPALGAEFSETALPAGWESTLWPGSSGGSSFNGSVATVDGALLATTGALFAPGRALEFVATFGASPYQHVGFGQTLAVENEYWAMFSTKDTTNTLHARTNVNGAMSDVFLPGAWVGSAHRYRIEWSASAVVFSIDGVVVHTETLRVPAQPMRPVISDYTAGGPATVVNWLHMSPYASLCTFTSRVLDKGSRVDWLALTSTGDRPAGTSVAFATHSGDTATPDGTWSAWEAVGADGAIASPTSRYIQYQMTLATTNVDVTPEVARVSITSAELSNLPPVANGLSVATAEDTDVAVTLSATDPESGALAYSVVAQPQHGALSGTARDLTYTPELNYHGADGFTYKANDGTQDSNIATVSINVTSVNDAPVATGDTYPATEDIPLVVVAASGVLANDTDVDSAALTAVKVSGPAHGALVLNADGSFNYTPALNYNGPDSFTYKANDGALDSNTVTVNIALAAVNDAPAATADSYSTAEDAPLEIDAALGVLVNDADVDSAALTAVKVSGPFHGALVLNADGSFNYTPEPNYNGPDSFTYKANDGTLDSDSATVTIDVTAVNDAPTLDPIADQNNNEGDIVVLALSANDIDGGALTFSATNLPPGLSIDPASGALAGTVSYVAAANSLYTVIVTVDDGTGSPTSSTTRTFTWTIANVNRAPVATGADVTTAEDTAVTIDLAATDADSDGLTYLVGAPSHGTLSGTAPHLTYTPAANYHGPDGFTFKANDGTADSNEATVSITVTPVNDAPVLGDIGNKGINEGLPLAFNATATDVDLPANTLTYSLVNAPAGASINPATGAFSWTPSEEQGPGAYTFSVVVSDGQSPALTDSEQITVTVNEVNVAPVLALIGNKGINEGLPLAFAASATDADLPANTLTYSLVNAPAGAGINPATGAFSWTPSEEQGPGAYTFSVVVSDGQSPALTGSEQIVVTVNEVNVAPVLALIADKSVAEENELAFTATATDADLPANTLTFSLVDAPAGASIDASTGAFTWTPSEAQGPNDYTFTVKVTDNGATPAAAQQVIHVSVAETNLAPVATADAYSTLEDTALAIGAASGVLANDTDADGNPLTAVVVGGPAHGVLVLNADGSFTYTPAANYNGPDSFTYKANDGTADSNIATVSINVTSVNDAPTLDDIPNQASAEGVTINLPTSANDIEGDPLVFSATGLPPDLVINPTTGVIAGTISYAAAESGNPYAVTVTVSDGHGGTAGHSFTWTISDVLTPRLALPALSGANGATVVAPLTYAEATDVYAITFAIRYDPAVVTALSVSGTPTGWFITPNLTESGVITVVMVLNPAPGAGQKLNGSGTLAQVSFRIVGGPGASTALALSARANDVVAPPSRLTNGAVTVPRASIAGGVHFWNDNAPLAGATVQLAPATGAPQSATTGADGNFTFGSLTGGNWTLTPAKSDAVRGVTSLDATYVLRHVAGLAPLSDPAALLAADINEVNGVSEVDAFNILQVSVGLVAPPVKPLGHVWAFLPPARTYTPLLADQANQNFTAVLLGDVSGNWSPISGAASSAGVLSIEAQPAGDGETDLLFTLAAAAPVHSIDLLLRYNAEQIQVVSVQSLQLPGAMAASNLGEAGVVRMALAAGDALPAGARVATVRVRSAGNALDALLNVEATADERPLAVRLPTPPEATPDIQYRIYLPSIGR